MAVSPLLKQFLDRYGLGSLTNWANEALIQGWSEDQILLELYERPEFNQRFPAIKQRLAAGYPPISPEEYLQYENQISSLATQWGMNISKQTVDNMIANNKSFREAEEVVGIAAAAVYSDDNFTRDELQRMYPEITGGDLIAYWMKPQQNLGTLTQKYRNAQLSGAAVHSGFGPLTDAQATKLQQSGMDRSAAVSAFQELVQNEDLFRSSIATEADISRDEQLDAIAGNAELQQEIEQRRARRLADYTGGSSFAAGREGFAVGSAPQ